VADKTDIEAPKLTPRQVEAAKTESYILKPGIAHTVIENGEIETYVGAADQSVTLDLTKNQLAAFGDKFVGVANSDRLLNPTTHRAGEETLGFNTIEEAEAAKSPKSAKEDAKAGAVADAKGANDTAATSPASAGTATAATAEAKK
jgi:hypothetical protein